MRAGIRPSVRASAKPVGYGRRPEPPRGRSSMVEPQPSKLVMPVRSRSPALTTASQVRGTWPRRPDEPEPGRGPQTGHISLAPGFAGQAAERLRDGLVTVAGGMLVDHCSARAGVTEPGHQLLESRAGSSREGAARVSQIVKVDAGSTGGGACPDPDRAEVRTAQLPALRADEDQAAWPMLGK